MASDELGGLCRRTAGRDAALGLPGDTRSPAASLDTHAFDETANSHNQSTSEVAHWYETSTLTDLGPGDTPYDHVSSGLPLSGALRDSVPRRDFGGIFCPGISTNEMLAFCRFLASLAPPSAPTASSGGPRSPPTHSGHPQEPSHRNGTVPGSTGRSYVPASPPLAELWEPGTHLSSDIPPSGACRS